MSGDATLAIESQSFDEHWLVPLTECVDSLNIRENSVQPIFALPPEILGKIFKHLARTYGFVRFYKWIGVSHVCTLWRSVALDEATLWSQFSITPRVEWMTELLKRSKQAPLLVAADFDEEDSAKRKAFEFVAKEAGRIRELTLVAPQDMLDDLMSVIDNPMPLLRLLHVSGMENDFSIPEPSSGIWIRLLQQARPLETLHVKRYAVRCGDLVIPSLKHLTVAELHSTCQASVYEFLDILESLPLLEELHLGGVFSDNDTVEKANPRSYNKTIALSNLHALHVGADFESCICFMKHLSLPSISALSLSCTGLEGGYALARCLARNLPEAFLSKLSAVCLSQNKHSARAYFREHDNRFNEEDEHGADEHERGGNDEEDEGDGEGDYSGEESEEDEGEDGEELVEQDGHCTLKVMFCQLGEVQQRTRLGSFLERFTLAVKVTALSLKRFPRARRAEWKNILAPMKDVKYAHIEGKSKADRALVAMIIFEDEDCLLPKLHTLALEKMKLKDDYTGSHERDSFGMLRECLEMRREVGLDIKRIKLTRCSNVVQCDIDTLGELLETVGWDGKVQIVEPVLCYGQYMHWSPFPPDSNLKWYGRPPRPRQIDPYY
ncbi:uncharacterized protein LAESUDRAFT_757802 [Laetiporus sulphureus 93-53]|uniref:F-box domain-containing protein n=1 Tax=Laetiporus sulphureus 93-53 TaxID=1314785 RepID=A0A165F0G2_9APHY|nr:uncharacterized protein LAESUDRAFT_757802 [Laetiporus sulphureus 93-53]KZT08103.1 hypothetical protein LAESUDRAFT_757802 [Laetiporus sulphureus 93-53]